MTQHAGDDLHTPSPGRAEFIIGPAFGRTRWRGHPLPTGEGKPRHRCTTFQHYATSWETGRRPSRWQIANTRSARFIV
jgi:hypothetical protein